jgi:diaminopimelate epimerase
MLADQNRLYCRLMKSTLSFYKYHGAGNDFIILDAADLKGQSLSSKRVAEWCKRRYGVGADGLMVFTAVNNEEVDFEMQYYNADGSSGMMCGNGGRCIALYAHEVKGVSKTMRFSLKTSIFQAEILDSHSVALGLQSVSTIKVNDDATCFCDTGSPHHIEWVAEPLNEVAVFSRGQALRNRYHPDGCNVNFVAVRSKDQLAIRTYERGVEDETHACGTGVAAAAISAHKMDKVEGNAIKVSAIGGELEVQFQENDGVYSQVTLIGPAQAVFEGTLLWP